MHLNTNVKPILLSICPFLKFKLYDLCMFIEFHPLMNIFIQVGNFNPQIFVKLMILQCVCGI